MLLKISIIILVSLFCCSLSDAADSTVVRIQVDLDSTKVYLDGSFLEFDNFGNQIMKNSPFIVSLVQGEHRLQIYHSDTILVDTLISTIDEDLLSLSYTFIEQFIPGESLLDTTNAFPVVIASEPEEAEIRIDTFKLGNLTPFKYWSVSDSVSIQVSKQGFEPLSIEMNLARDNITALFRLRKLPPVPFTADSFGLAYLTERPTIDIREADGVMERYRGVAESFLIFPFAQGILAKIVLDDDQQKEANVLVISGAVLTTGTYLLGKIFSSKRRKEILRENEQISEDNLRAKLENSEIDRMVREKNDELYESWEQENSTSGVVEIK